MAVEKVRDTAAVSGIEGTGGGGCADCSSAVVVSVLTGPPGFVSEATEPILRGSCCAGVLFESNVDISTGVGLGWSSASRLDCWGMS